MFGILLLVVAVGSMDINNRDDLAEQQVEIFENYFHQAYEKHGMDGIAIYFTNDFQSINAAGNVFNKTEHLKYLETLDDIPAMFFVNRRQCHFDYSSSNLFVSYYHEQLLWVYTLVPNRSLLGGYQIKKLSLAGQ